MIDPRDLKALTTAYEISEALKHYPVLDDSDYYERESEAQDSDFEQYQSDFEQNILKVLGLDDMELSKTEQSELTQLAYYLYETDCSYRGQSDAYVTEETALEHVDEYELVELAESNNLAELLLAAVGYERGPDGRKTEIGAANEAK